MRGHPAGPAAAALRRPGRGRLAARGRSLAPALFGWQLARRPGRATGPVLLLVLAVSSGILALGQHTAWTDSQRDQADFATAGGLRISGSSMAPMGRAGRYGALPGAERLIPVSRQEQQLPGGGVGELLALDAAEVGERVPLRADLRGGRAMRDLFAPLAATDQATRPGPGATGATASGATGATGDRGIALPGSPHRIDLDVAVRSSGTGWATVSLLLRDRFGTVHATPPATLPESGEATLPFALDPLTGAPIGSAAAPLTLAGVRLSYAGDGGPAGEGGELTLRRVAVSDTPGGAAMPVTTTGTPAWQSSPPQGGPRNLQAPALSPSRPDPRTCCGCATGAASAPRRASGPPCSPPPPRRPPPRSRGRHHRLPARHRRVRGPDGQRHAGRHGRPGAHHRRRGQPPRRRPHRARRRPAHDRPLPAGDRRPAARHPHRVVAARGLGRRPGTRPRRAELRAGARTERVQLREEITAGLLDDPLSAGPQSALAALAAACAVLAAIGFATSTAAERRARGREFSILLALGAPRRSLARASFAEGGVLIALGTSVGTGLGVALVHLMAPLIVLTPAAHRPFPPVRVDMPFWQTLLTAAAIAAVPLLSAALGGPRGRDIAARLRPAEEM